MWYRCENRCLDRPLTLDDRSSKKYVYLRKDILLVNAVFDKDMYIPAHYEWLEQKIPKSDWDFYQKTIGYDEALNDVYAALTEIAEMIVG